VSLSLHERPIPRDQTRSGAGDLLKFLSAKVRVAAWHRGRLLGAVLLSTFVLGATVTFAKWYLAQDARLGVLHFPISCGWQSQREFTTATSLLHLFQFEGANDVYTDLVKQDPECAMGYWGIAMSKLRNPLYLLPNDDDVNIARRALTAAEAARHNSPRERAYIAAARKLFPATGIPGWNERLIAYAQAMEAAVTKFPEDREATVFFALALNFAAPPSDSISRERTRATELLLQVFSEQPDHPGIFHYLTYCLGHEKYQPKPFERSTMTNPAQRIVLGAFAFFALLGLGIFVAFTADFRPGASERTGFGGPFVLTASDTRVVTDRTFRGRYMLIYFGYTHCPDICPATLITVGHVLEKLGPLAAKVQPIFVSIDPERDTPAVIGKYLEAFDRRFVGLTGSPAEIAAAAKQYRVYYKKSPSENSDDYSMDHSPYIYLMGPDGGYVTLFSPDQSPDQIEARLRELLTIPAADDATANSPNTRTTSSGD
jgi:protein SCO1/2